MKIPLLLSSAVLLSCSASSTPPAGGRTQEQQQTPSDLPPGVNMSTDSEGNPIYTDGEGNVLEPMVVTGSDGMPMTVLTNPNTGATIPVDPPSTAPMGPVEDPGGPAIIVNPEPEDILVDPSVTPPEDGDLVDGVVCNSAEVTYEPVIPTVMLLIDRSTSMFNNQIPPYVGGSPPVGEYSDRWEAVRGAVDLLADYAAEVQFGALTYTGYNPQQSTLDTCPELQGSDLAIATDNFAQIQALLPPSAEAIPQQKSETPTAEGILAATELLAAVPAEGPKYIVLITDGLPELCGNFDRGAYCGADPVIGAVQAAYALGIQTFVIGIGFEAASGEEAPAAEYVLNAAAHAGQGLEVPPPSEQNHISSFKSCVKDEAVIRGVTIDDGTFWNEENWRTGAAATYGETGTTFADQLYLLPGDAQLGAQLAEVVAGVRSCSFEMADAVVRDKANLGAVQLTLVDGMTNDLVFGDPNGWVLDATRDDVVVVQGTACEQVQNQDLVKAVRIEFPCEVRIPKAR